MSCLKDKVAPEVKISPPISEQGIADSVVKDILRELGDNRSTKHFGFNQRFRGIDLALEAKGDRENFVIEARRFFNREHTRYLFQDGQLSKVAVTVDPFPQAPFSKRQEFFLDPSQADVTAEMILYLLKTTKEEAKAFGGPK